MKSKKLSILEMQALYWSVNQPHLIKGTLKAALRRAARKLSDQLLIARARKRFDEGATAARKGLSHRPPKKYGTIETLDWYDGYESIKPKCKNPYRSLG